MDSSSSTCARREIPRGPRSRRHPHARRQDDQSRLEASPEGHALSSSTAPRPALQRHRQGRTPSQRARAQGQSHDRRHDRLGRRRFAYTHGAEPAPLQTSTPPREGGLRRAPGPAFVSPRPSPARQEIPHELFPFLIQRLVCRRAPDRSDDTSRRCIRQIAFLAMQVRVKPHAFRVLAFLRWEACALLPIALGIPPQALATPGLKPGGKRTESCLCKGNRVHGSHHPIQWPGTIPRRTAGRA